MLPQVIRVLGVMYEYREDDRLLGVMTGFVEDRTMWMQHMVVWPGAPATTLLRMVRAVEAATWGAEDIDQIVLDVEHNHPNREALVFLASWRGYALFHTDEKTSWFRKVRP